MRKIIALAMMASKDDGQPGDDRRDAVLRPTATQRGRQPQHDDHDGWHIIDMHRKRRRRPELMETAAFEAALADYVDDPYDTLTDAITLYAAVSVLSERQRDAILLHYGMDFTAAEAAKVTGNQESTVRSQLRTGRERLAYMLKLHCPEHPDGKNRS
ncbi:sigma-70 family RNA polymerase sigma factor [Streptomyces sp. TG1A-8]|uniref:RNA polymerase sigma factor n=1 Tax=Streptomyces sp. TG1A-8 TaxID=3051385 RepID=UPI00265BF9C8|nr:sigma-70 family RNA polymerase sigma factor [Streptomyces sp. TG1A-8]MDO0923977.1 sigma-70 family RNA polymerase sigma factor [Streptomyces sp. TG1A-8]